LQKERIFDMPEETIFGAAVGGADGGADAPAAAAAQADVQGFTLPEAYASDPALANFKSLEDLCKSYKETKSMVGSREPAVLAENATPEQIAEFFGKMGAGDMEKYKDISFSDKIPEYFRTPENLAKYHKLLADSNITPVQARKLFENYEAMEVAALEAEAAEHHQQILAEIAKLRTDWGDKYQENLNAAQAVWKKLRPDWDIATHPLGDNVDVIRLMADLAPIVLNGQMVSSSNAPANALAEVDAQIEAIYKNPDYTKPGPLQNGLIDEMSRLMARKLELTGKK
jgi:hypothetical protein